jgi:branched-chain amino acid transport system permease protein
MTAALAALRGPAPAARAGRLVAWVLGFFLAVEILFKPPLNLYLFGIANGALYGLIAVGIILIYRTNRIINFAAAGLGAVPALTAVFLNTQKGVSYWISLPLALLGGLLLGAVVDVVVIRRFSKAPRLILTVATIGLVQILAFIAIYIPIWFGAKGQSSSSRLPTPWVHILIKRHGSPLLDGNYIFAVAVVIAVGLALAAFFRYTRMGIALRASAENADRASLLGIPVRRVQTVAWMLAGLLAAITIFLRAPLVGVPIDGSLGYSVLLFTLAAAVIARMENIPVALLAGMGVGVLEQASVFSTGSNNLSASYMLYLILFALLLQRGQLSRAYDAGVSTWQAVKEFRPVPAELRGTPEVQGARVLLLVLVAALFIGAPHLVTEGEIGKLTLLPIFAIVSVSLVVLTGWAGQISLGQFGIVGVGAAAAGGLAANHNIDFFAALLIGMLAGAAVSVLIGLPALRVQGLYLAVTTLAFGGAMEYYYLRPNYFIGRHVLPKPAARIGRPLLLQRIDLANDRTFYYLCLVFLVGVILAARSFRKNRSGRVLIAARDNQRGAPAYAINVSRNRLAAFAISGAIAALAGVLLAYQQRAVDYQAYGIVPSIEIFVATVIGGLTSIPGAVAGAVVIKAVQLFGEEHLKGLSLLVTGPGLLLILLVLPGGFAEGFFRLRDRGLRAIAARHGIHVPSLVADRRIEPEDAERHLIEDAEQHVLEVESFDAVERRIVCPVCDESLTLEDASTHEHLRPKVGAR